MTPYLATCHVLSLLVDTTLSEFETAMASNPFFKQDCLGIPAFLEAIRSMGLIHRVSRKSEERLGLSERGRAFEQHILRWNRYDPQVRAQQTRRQEKRRAAPHQDIPLQKQCPTCAQESCGLYLFVILYERFLQGHTALHIPAEVAAAFQAPFLHYYYLDHSLSFADCSPEEQQRIQTQFLVGVDAHYGEQWQQPHRLPELWSDDSRCQQVSYWQQRYKILPTTLLKSLTALRHPSLSGHIDPGLNASLGVIHFGPVAVEEHVAVWPMRWNDRLKWVFFEHDGSHWHQKAVRDI